MQAYFNNRLERRHVLENLSDLLVPLKNHLDDDTKKAIDIAMNILQETPVKEEKGE